MAHEHPSLGIHHLGIAVDDLDELRSRLDAYDGGVPLRPEPGDGLHRGEYRVSDPLGLPVSISTCSFHVPTGERQAPSIRHVALAVPRSDEMVRFYTTVFGFRESAQNEERRKSGNTVRWLGDGSTAVALLPEPLVMAERNRAEGITGCWQGGLNHFGFLVEDMGEALAKLPGNVNTSPSTRPSAEYRATDPEFNGHDISQEKGYEVDTGVWVRYTSPGVLAGG